MYFVYLFFYFFLSFHFYFSACILFLSIFSSFRWLLINSLFANCAAATTNIPLLIQLIVVGATKMSFIGIVVVCRLKTVTTQFTEPLATRRNNLGSKEWISSDFHICQKARWSIGRKENIGLEKFRKWS